MSASLAPAIVISTSALIFTVASFWWINVRTGRLKMMPFSVFSAYIRADRSFLRLPVTIHNTGAAPLVVVDLRVELSSQGVVRGAASKSYRRTIKPSGDDVEDFPHPYAIPGRTVVTKFVEFAADPSAMATGRSAQASVSALDRRGRWRHIGTFEVRTDAIGDPGAYITYSNDPTHWPPEHLNRAAQALAKIRTQIQAQRRTSQD